VSACAPSQTVPTVAPSLSLAFVVQESEGIDSCGLPPPSAGSPGIPLPVPGLSRVQAPPFDVGSAGVWIRGLSRPRGAIRRCAPA